MCICVEYLNSFRDIYFPGLRNQKYKKHNHFKGCPSPFIPSALGLKEPRPTGNLQEAWLPVQDWNLLPVWAQRAAWAPFLQFPGKGSAVAVSKPAKPGKKSLFLREGFTLSSAAGPWALAGTVQESLVCALAALAPRTLWLELGLHAVVPLSLGSSWG